MKKIITAILILSIVVFSCTKKSNPTQLEIAPPAATPTITSQAATGTMTNTLTPTVTLTAQTIPADTATMTPTQINTDIIPGTITPTGTDTEIQTAIATDVNTGIPSAMPTDTDTEIPTAIPTDTDTEVSTAIPTDTVTATVTETSTDSCTGTDTDTPTVTETSTDTATPTITFTSTDTPIPYSDVITVQGGTFNQSDGTNSFSSTVSTFIIGRYFVTYDLWYVVYQWAVAHDYTFQNAGAEGSNGTAGAAPTSARYQPVTIVNWRDAIVWCNAYSERYGLSPCYTYSGGVIRDSTNGNAAACDGAVCAWTNNGYRLQSESEYQYAASWKGTDSSNGAIEFPLSSGNYWTPYNYASGATADYTDAAATELVAWYNANSGGSKDVGGKTPNALGIYDMSGNLWEWCWDFYNVYPAAGQTDYRGSASGPNRVQRGGGFSVSANGVSVGNRNPYGPKDGWVTIGFRVARSY
jgi:sulfatase modifying factor 1